MSYLRGNKMKYKFSYTIGTIPKSNIKNTERGKIDNPGGHYDWNCKVVVYRYYYLTFCIFFFFLITRSSVVTENSSDL